MRRMNRNAMVLWLNLYHLEQLEKFTEELELLWRERLKEYEIRGNEFEDEETKQEFFEFYYDDWSVYRDNYPNIANYSVLVSSHSLLEKMCADYYLHALENNADWKTINQKHKHALNYIDCFRSNFGNHLLSKKTYQKFRDFNQLRNKIVHSSGKVNIKQDKGIMNIIQKSETISLSNHEEIILTSDYLKSVFEMVREIVTQIHNSIYSEE